MSSRATQSTPAAQRLRLLNGIDPPELQEHHILVRAARSTSAGAAPPSK